jgi:hypothetical protein
VNVAPDRSLGGWVSRVRAAIAAVEGGGEPPSPYDSRTTGIAANIPPTTENPEDS